MQLGKRRNRHSLAHFLMDPRITDAVHQLLADIHRVTDAHAGARVSVSVRWKRGSIDVGETEVFHAASTMKVAVMLRYLQDVADGIRSLDDRIRVENRFTSLVDASPYAIEDDSDDELYTWIGAPVSASYLIERMITRSSNLATNLLIESLGATSIQPWLDRRGLSDHRVLRGVEDVQAFRAGRSNTTTSAALAALMWTFDRGFFGDPLDAWMHRVLCAQTDRLMIPAGTPSEAVVAHKTGWLTSLHHDAAYVTSPDAMPYALVILTEGIAPKSLSGSVGATITQFVHAFMQDQRNVA